MTKKYGADQVAQIITFGTMAASAAIRDVGRVKQVSLSEVDKIAKMVPISPDMTHRPGNGDQQGAQCRL